MDRKKRTFGKYVGQMCVPLTAGDLSLLFDRGRLVDFTYQGSCVLKEIYFALRDDNWGTVPFVITDGVLEQEERSFKLMFRAEHDRDGIVFRWNGTVTGGGDSVVSFSFEGTAGSDFRRNRIGFCVLHPDSCAGQQCVIKHGDDTYEDGQFPYFVAPHQPFFDIKEIISRPSESALLSVAFDGEIFEMEDQRNWTDASFKTYCTPLGRPFPVAVRTGTALHQSVTVSLKKDWEGEKVAMPSIGCCILNSLSEEEKRLTAAMNPSHLRYDYFFGNENGIPEIVSWLKTTDIRLVLAVHFPDDSGKWLEEIRTVLKAAREVLHSVIVYGVGNVLPKGDLAALLKQEQELRGIPVGSGTDAFFTQLNRERPDAAAWDFVAYSNNPQVHAFDNGSVMETVRGQRWNIRSCRAIYKKTVYVTPVTMKMRWNPDATRPREVGERLYAEEADVRQSSLFLAVWTLKSICMMTNERAALTTYYELTGQHGVMGEQGIYPVYLTLLFVGRYRNCRCFARWDERLCALCVREDGKWHGLIGNCTEENRRALMERGGRGTLISADSWEDIRENPGRILKDAGKGLMINAGSEVILPAYSMLWVDFSE